MLCMLEKSTKLLGQPHYGKHLCICIWYVWERAFVCVCVCALERACTSRKGSKNRSFTYTLYAFKFRLFLPSFKKMSVSLILFWLYSLVNIIDLWKNLSTYQQDQYNKPFHKEERKIIKFTVELVTLPSSLIGEKKEL